MKKIFLVLFLLISSITNAQSGLFGRIAVKDSIYPHDSTMTINASGYYLNGVLQSFGGGGSTDTSLLVHKYNGRIFNARLSDSVFRHGYNLDTSNIAFINQGNIFTGSNTFNVSSTHKGYILFENTANTWIKAIDNYALFLGTSNDTAIKIDSLNEVTFYESVVVDGVITVGNLSVGSLADLNNVAFNGVVSTDLSFEKGGTVNIGTTDNFGLNIVTNGTNAISIDNTQIVTINNVGIIDTSKNIYNNRSDTINGIYNFNVIPTVASFFQNIGRTIQYWLPNSLSDTLLTRSQTQTITNKTIDGGSNTVTGLQRGLMYITSASGFNPSNSTSYYIGTFPASNPQTSDVNRRVYVPSAMTIDAITVQPFITVASTGGQNATFYLCVDGSRVATIGTSTLGSTGINLVTGSALAGAITGGGTHYFTIEMATPAWTTPPTGIAFQVVVQTKY